MGIQTTHPSVERLHKGVVGRLAGIENQGQLLASRRVSGGFDAEEAWSIGFVVMHCSMADQGERSCYVHIRRPLPAESFRAKSFSLRGILGVVTEEKVV